MRRIAALAAAAALAAGALTACGFDDTGSGGPAKLRFLSMAWQKESVAANRALVDEWNSAHPEAQVEYVQGNWDSVHDQLLTSFEGGQAPDVFHDESPDLAGFAAQGHLADLSGLIPPDMKDDIRQSAWDTVTFDGGVYGVPFLQESQVIIANKAALDASGVRVPTATTPWTWDEFREAAKAMTKDGGYGVAWALKQPVNRVLNLSLTFDGKYFVDSGGKTTAKFDAEERRFPQLVHDQLYVDKSASPEALGMGGADPLPGFFAGKYAMLPAGVWYRQQVKEQAPAGFQWVTLPAPKGTGQNQGAGAQTLSVAKASPHQQKAVEFIRFFLSPANQARLAKGDWLVPTSKQAAARPELTAAADGWDVAAESSKHLVVAPFQKVKGFDEWKSKIATPALQQYFANKISMEELRDKLVGAGNDVLARYER